MNNFNAPEPEKRNKKKFNINKNKKFVLEDEQKDKAKLNKVFKQKKRELSEDDDWENWREEYR